MDEEKEGILVPTLRDIVDGKVILAAFPVPSAGGNSTASVPVSKSTKTSSNKANGKASPMADHVSKHLQDPVGSTKDQFNKLQEAKSNYDMTREETQRQLSPVQAVINHVSSIHNLQPNSGVAPLGGDPNNPMASDDPNAGQVDENGNPLPPSQNPAGANGPGTVPVNMGQTVGKMNQSRPSLVGNQPGVSPGPQQSVVPPKAGVPKPGGAQNMQYNKTAAPPKGNRSMPGAKGPGDPKVQNKNQKSQANSGRAIKVHVSAGALIDASHIPLIEASSTIKSHMGMETLRTVSRLSASADIGMEDLRRLCQDALKDKVGGSSSSGGCGSPIGSPWITDLFPLSSYFVYNSDGKSYRQDYKLVDGDIKLKGDPKKVRQAYVTASAIRAGGPGSGRHKVGDKVTTKGGNKIKHVIDVNYDNKKTGEFDAQPHYPQHFIKVGSTPDADPNKTTWSRAQDYIKAAGTSHGLKKQWSTRRKGHLSAKEKDEHYKTMDAGGPGSGRHKQLGDKLDSNFKRMSQIRSTDPKTSKIAESLLTKARASHMQGDHTSTQHYLSKAIGVMGGETSYPSKSMEAGPEALNDKATGPGNALDYNPKMNAKKSKMKGCGCAKCKAKMNANNILKAI